MYPHNADRYNAAPVFWLTPMALPSRCNAPSAVWNSNGDWFAAGTPIGSTTASSAAELLALPETVMQHLKDHPHHVAVGLVAYDAGDALHGINRSTRSHPARPHAVVHFHDRVRLIALSQLEDLDRHYQAPSFSSACPAFISDTDKLAYFEHLARIREYLRAGDCYQVNYTRRFSAPFSGNAYHAWRRLVARHPAPHASYFSIDPAHTVFGVAPERFLQIRNGIVKTEPIKGSRPRGQTGPEDIAYGEDLARSEKDRAENLMIVDLLRNDLGKVCLTGSVQAESLFELRRFSNVQHLVSTVIGTLRNDISPLDALLLCFPGGSITGAPKKRAMEIIAELEPYPRGFYCGSQFVLDADGNLDSNILIRTFQTDGNLIHCHGGGGIVIDSDPEQEFAESAFKITALMQAL